MWRVVKYFHICIKVHLSKFFFSLQIATTSSPQKCAVQAPVYFIEGDPDDNVLFKHAYDLRQTNPQITY